MIRKPIILPITMATLLALSLASCLSDIRPKYMLEKETTQADKNKGRQLLEELAESYGGQKKWLAEKSARAIITDDWPVTLMRLAASPWYKNKQRVALDWLVSSDNSRLTFLEEPNKDLIWGIQNWSMWHQQPKGKRVFNKSNDIKFWLPTIEYFIEAPFRLVDADFISYAGKGKSLGQEYDLVFVSWQSAKPQKDIDQYIVWINSQTKKMDILQYTVRDMMPFITGTMIYEDFRKVKTFTFAFKMTVVGHHEKRDKIIHQMLIDNFTLNTGKDQSFYIPEPRRIRHK